MTARTPGHWKAECGHVYSSFDGRIHFIGWSESEANALLMAAAPDLLKALKAILNHVDDSYVKDEVADALAAIARAEGRDA